MTGQALACENLRISLATNERCTVVNLSKRTFHQGVHSLGRIWEVATILKRVSQHNSKSDIIYFTVSESIAGNLKDLLIYLICWSKLHKMVIHLHGGAAMKEIMAGKYPGLGMINAFFLRRLGAVIVLGDRLRSIYSDHVLPSRLHTIPNFAPDECFVSMQEIEQKFAHVQTLRILFLSNLLPGKGHQELLAAISLLPKEVRHLLKVDFAGGFESDHDEARFRQQTSQITDVEINVHGTVQGEAKRQLLLSAHLFCLPTYYPYEGQPISILEAYASGCAVMTTNHSGIFDIFTPDMNGIEVFPRSPESIAQAILHAISHPDELRRHATHNQHQALEKYRTSIHIKALQDVIQSVQCAPKQK